MRLLKCTNVLLWSIHLLLTLHVLLRWLLPLRWHLLLFYLLGLFGPYLPLLWLNLSSWWLTHLGCCDLGLLSWLLLNLQDPINQDKYLWWLWLLHSLMLLLQWPLWLILFRHYQLQYLLIKGATCRMEILQLIPIQSENYVALTRKDEDTWLKWTLSWFQRWVHQDMVPVTLFLKASAPSTGSPWRSSKASYKTNSWRIFRWGSVRTLHLNQAADFSTI
jgi:hypothetical protein